MTRRQCLYRNTGRFTVWLILHASCNKGAWAYHCVTSKDITPQVCTCCRAKACTDQVDLRCMQSVPAWRHHLANIMLVLCASCHSKACAPRHVTSWNDNTACIYLLVKGKGLCRPMILLSMAQASYRTDTKTLCKILSSAQDHTCKLWRNRVPWKTMEQTRYSTQIH